MAVAFNPLRKNVCTCCLSHYTKFQSSSPSAAMIITSERRRLDQSFDWPKLAGVSALRIF